MNMVIFDKLNYRSRQYHESKVIHITLKQTDFKHSKVPLKATILMQTHKKMS